MIIRFEEGNNCFNYRVVGIAVHENSVLLHQGEGEDFWTFPGGRAEFGETAEQTLKREMQEEIGVEVEVVRLLWFVENFFSYAGQHYHEIALYFLMRFPTTCQYLTQPGRFLGEEGAMKLTFQWFPQQPEILSGLPLLPSFLQTALQCLPESVRFFGNRCPSIPYLVAALCECGASFQIKANAAEEIANIAQAVTASFEHFDFVIETFDPTA